MLVYAGRVLCIKASLIYYTSQARTNLTHLACWSNSATTPTIVEPGCAMTLNLGLDICPPGCQLRRRGRQRGSQNCFDLVKSQLDLFCRSRLLAKPLLQG